MFELVQQLVDPLRQAVFRQDNIAAAFRDWLEEHEALVIRLPDGSFKESNTSVRTRLVVLEKWVAGPEEVSGELAAAALEMQEDRYQYALPGMGAKDKRIPWRQLKLF